MRLGRSGGWRNIRNIGLRDVREPRVCLGPVHIWVVKMLLGLSKHRTLGIARFDFLGYGYRLVYSPQLVEEN
jgi:hypothetical protein